MGVDGHRDEGFSVSFSRDIWIMSLGRPGCGVWTPRISNVMKDLRKF